MTAAEILRSIVERIERNREEKKAFAQHERDLFAEAKSKDFDTKALRRVLQRRAMGDEACSQLDGLIETYEAALGGKRVAAEAIQQGASIREAAKKAGVGYGTARRAKNRVSGSVPPHDPDTGEIEEPPAGASPNDATASGQVAAALSPAAVPAGEPDEPTVSVSVHRGGEVLADSGPVPMAALKAPISDDMSIPDFLDRRKKLLVAVAQSRGEP